MYKPTFDRVIIKPTVNDDEKTEGGIYIPSMAKEKPLIGEIVAVGPGHRDNGGWLPVPFEVGQKVLYGKYAGIETKIDKVDYLIMESKDVMAVI